MSWSSVKTEGIVLTSAPVQEADRRYKILTAQFGKVECIGRGALKGKAKLTAHLEPFAVVNVELIEGRRRTTVISVERKEAFSTLQNALDHRLLAITSLHLLDRYTKEHEADEMLYYEVYEWLVFLNTAPQLSLARSAFLLGAFLLRTLKHLGYETQLDHCMSCQEEIFPLAFRWHGKKGGIVCTNCIQGNMEEWISARVIHEDIIKLLRFARESVHRDLLRPPLESDHLREFSAIVHELICFHIPQHGEQPFWEGLLME